MIDGRSSNPNLRKTISESDMGIERATHMSNFHVRLPSESRYYNGLSVSRVFTRWFDFRLGLRNRFSQR